MTEIALESLVLKRGKHESPAAGLCVMEAVAYFAKEPHSDRPVCACPVITNFAMRLNDRLGEENRQKLKPFIPHIVGTRRSEGEENQRRYILADWTVRECVPLRLDIRGSTKAADELRALKPITGKASASEARVTTKRLRKELNEERARRLMEGAYASAASAADYASASADYAAASAADDAADDAADYDAYCAVDYAVAADYDAYCAVDYDAYYAAAYPNPRKITAEQVNLSTLSCLDRLIKVTEVAP